MKNLTKLFTLLSLCLLIQPAMAQKVLLVGDAAEVSGLPAAEQNAYNWALSNYGEDAMYMSFGDIATNGLPMSARGVWFHFEDDPTLPASATSIQDDLDAFLSQGGGMLLSGFATQLLSDAPTETLDNDPAGPDVAWGVKPLTGKEDHPIFAGLTPTTDWVDANWGGFRTISDSVAGREAISWWTGGSYPGEPLAVMPWWDVNNSDIPVIGEIQEGLARVVTCSAPGFNWVSADINGANEQSTLEQLTANMINYVTAEVEVMVVGEGDMASLPEGEKNAYDWVVENFGLRAAYSTFDDIANNGIPSTVKTIWFHFEDDPMLPASAASATTAVGDFVNNGGHIFVSGFATQYLVDINATMAGPTETLNNDPAGPDVAWGVKPLAGKESHPFFANMTLTTDWVDANWGGYRTIGDTVAGREAIRWWNDGSFPGEPLAVMPWWDVNNSDIPVLGTLAVGEGLAIFASAPGYHWLPAMRNAAEPQANLEQLTENILTYVVPDFEGTKLMIGDAASVGELPQGEQNAYNWALGSLGADAKYMSFDDVANMGIPATINSIWYHYEDTSMLAGDFSTAAPAITEFISNGGGLVLSGFATQVATEVGVTDVAPTEVIDKDPAGPDVAWGIAPIDTTFNNHPIFADLTETTDWVDANWAGFRTIGDTVPGREAMAWWTANSFPGTGIGRMPWFGGTDLPVVGEILSSDGGGIIIATAPGYHWKNADINPAEPQGNLEQLTLNMLNYAPTLSEQQLFELAVDGGLEVKEGEEDGVVITISLTNTTFVDPINSDNWTISGLPTGITATVARVDAQTATVTLAGTAEDYDEDITDFTISIPASEFTNLRSESLESVGELLFRAFIEVAPVELKVALVGTEANMADLDEDEQAAYGWAMEEFGEDAVYYSFEDIVLDPGLLEDKDVLWFHYDKFIDLPLLADNPNTEKVFRDFREAGGGVFLSGAATQYVVNLGVTNAGPNQVQKAEEPFTNPDPWGYGQKVPDHPIFLNLPNPFFTLFSETGLREDLLAWWVINPNDPNYIDIPVEERFTGIQLASTEWDAQFNILVTVAEFPGAEGEGNVIAVGAGNYDWYLDNGTNDLQDNLELFTKNILSYLKDPVTTNVNDDLSRKLNVVAYPNPFSGLVNISFSLENRADVQIEIYDLQGQRVAQILNETRTAGEHRVQWEPAQQTAGVYMYRLEVDGVATHGKILMSN